jgi:maltooligosyltrehalose trehalohydrolase
MYALHRDLLRLRREEPVFRAQRRGGVDGAVLAPQAFVLRFFGDDGDDRLLLVNFGANVLLAPAPEPLLALDGGQGWEVLWSSEDPRYGGDSAVAEEREDGWRLPGESAVVMKPASPPRQQGT